MESRFSTVARGFAADGADPDKLWVGSYNIDYGDAMDMFGRENTSQQYSSPEFLHLDGCHPDEKPLWWLVLRWMKMMLLKTARSYHAKPLLLVMTPLLIGILFGFFVGRWQSPLRLAQPGKIQQTSKKAQQREQPRIHLLWIRRLAELFSAFWVRLGLVLTVFVLGDEDNNDKLPIGTTRENETRSFLKSDEGTKRESGVPADQVPRHVAVIMDGNRRYGKSKYGSVSKGHWDGSSKLVEFAKWCRAENISILTVFAFSSENWKRDPAEVASLMQIFATYCDELRVEAIEKNIKIMVLSTDYQKIPMQVRAGVKRMVNETQHCDGMIMNICLSYGSRGEIVGATKLVIEDVLKGKLDVKDVDEKILGERLLTYNCGGDPDVLIRTSGEVRISNFLLWQLAYTEFFFIEKPWPAIQKNDLLEVIRSYAKSRNRRYGK